jgi:hypothetical protein
LERALVPDVVVRIRDGSLTHVSDIGQDDVLGVPSAARLGAYMSKTALPERPGVSSKISQGRFLFRGTIVSGNVLFAVALLASIVACAVRVRSMYPPGDIPIWLWVVGVLTFLSYLAWWVAVCVGLFRVNRGAVREWSGSVARLRHELAAQPNVT